MKQRVGINYKLPLFIYFFILIYSLKHKLKLISINSINLYGVEDLFDKNELYYFFPNPGNLGDMLINTAEYEFFKKLGINVTTRIPHKLNFPFNIIIGGGGALIDKYGCGIYKIAPFLKNSHLKKSIFLSQSINNCSELLKLFNRKCIVLIREPYSYEYCIRNNNKAKFIRANDMAFTTNISIFSSDLAEIKNNDKIIDCNNFNVYTGNNCYFLSEEYYNLSYHKYTQFCQTYLNIFNKTSYKVNNKTIRFYFRYDGEKKINSKLRELVKGFDASVSNPGPWEFKDKQYTYFWAKMLLLMINNSDIVVTDRLHIAISAHLLHKEVYIYDNSYHKVSGVYEQTLSCNPKIHYMTSDVLPFNISDISKFDTSINSYLAYKYLNLSYKNYKYIMKSFI